MVTKKVDAASVITVPETQIGVIELGIVGTTPLLHNCMSAKARHTLLLPSPPKNAAEKAANLKHDPVAEFRGSIYRLTEDDAPTRVAALGGMFKGAMMTAALDLPGSNKSQIGRLVWIEGHYVPLWGPLQLHMGITRSADMARTPDVRTRAISPEWATVITVRFVKPLMTEKAVINLLAAGGYTAGVGDWRPQKGKGTFGQFRLVESLNDDPDLQRITAFGVAHQDQALEDAEPFDPESAELLSWYDSERKERGR